MLKMGVLYSSCSIADLELCAILIEPVPIWRQRFDCVLQINLYFAALHTFALSTSKTAEKL
jgi:hypothetical protein